MRYVSARERVRAMVQPPRRPEGDGAYRRAAREFEALRRRIERIERIERVDKGRRAVLAAPVQKNRPL